MTFAIVKAIPNCIVDFETIDSKEELKDVNNSFKFSKAYFGKDDNNEKSLLIDIDNINDLCDFLAWTGTKIIRNDFFDRNDIQYAIIAGIKAYTTE